MSPDIRLQRWFEAPPGVVFDAYTDPDAQRALRAGGPDWVVESECDLRVGGVGARSRPQGVGGAPDDAR